MTGVRKSSRAGGRCGTYLAPGCSTLRYEGTRDAATVRWHTVYMADEVDFGREPAAIVSTGRVRLSSYRDQ